MHPHCGDGVEFSVLFTDAATREVEVLHAAEYRVQQVDPKPLERHAAVCAAACHCGR